MLGAFLVVSLVAGVLAAGLAVPAIGASGLATTNAVDAFNKLPSNLEDVTLAAQTRVLAADGSTIATFFEENREPVKLDAISPFMQNAIVAIEDERFYEHGGVDVKGLFRAFVVNEVAGDASQGASTLTQQVVKNRLKEQAFLAGDKTAQDAASEKSNSRKLKEIRLAAALEQKLIEEKGSVLAAKKQILNDYLNIAWFGKTVNGIEAASKYYFGTTAKKLTLPQAAMLAGMIQSPPSYDISDRDRMDAALKRRNTVLDRMLQQKMIDQATHDKAVAGKIKPKITPTYQGCANAGTRAYFCDYVYNLITRGNDFTALGKTEEDRELAISRGGYTIRTTLEPKILKAAWKAVKEAIPPNDESKIATATVSVQPGTGKVLSMIQDKYYSVKKGRSNTTVNYSVDYKYGGSSGFLTGSTFKPVVLSTWLKAGKQLNASIDGSPGTVAMSSFKSCGSHLGATDSWSFVNSGDSNGSEGGTVWNATANSVNGAYIRMEQQLDLCDVQKTAESLGMHKAQADPDECIPNNRYQDTKHPKLTQRIPACIPSIVLGVVNQSPMTMANAYATFAASGKYCTPVVVTSIKDRNGKAVRVPKTKCTQVMDEKVANTATLGMSRVLTNGTAASVGPLSSGQPASGKTGTTNGSQATWFLGYTPQLATSVWVGPETWNGAKSDMHDVTIKGQHYSVIYGAYFAAPIWKKIMTTALEGKKIEQFPAADPSLVGVVHVDKPKPTKGKPGDGKPGDGGDDGDGGDGDGGDGGDGGGDGGTPTTPGGGGGGGGNG
jgi:membrane peptidoglycan carboxypeptidase